MKKILLSIIYFLACIFYTNYTKAQTLYGTTANGGNDDAGTINKFMPATNDLIVAKSFEGFASNPKGSLVQASNGKLYGMTDYGGSSDNGVIFSFDASTSTYTKLKYFDGTNGGNPKGSLVQASNGKLYGMTDYGSSDYVFVTK